MFTGELVRLRGFQEADLEHVRLMEADAATLRLRRTGVVYPGGEAETKAFWENNHTEQPTRVQFAIEATHDDRFVGRCVIRDVHRNHRSAELGIALLPAEIGNGFGRGALDLLVDFGLGAMALNRVWASIRADNARSLRLFEAAGFAREAVLRESALANDGSRVNVVSVSMLRREWLESRA